MKKIQPLCYRCEWRAMHNEGLATPRAECKYGAVSSCYQYEPVVPLVLKPIKGEKRPIMINPLYSGRVYSPGRADMLRLKKLKTKLGMVYYWGEKEK